MINWVKLSVIIRWVGDKKMGELFNLVEKIQNGDNHALEDVLRQFEPKVNKLLKQTVTNNRDDLRQDLLLTIIIKTREYKLDKVPDFEEFNSMIR